MTEKITKTKEEWKALLTPEQYVVLRQHATERAFTGALLDNKAEGIYRCAACGNALFKSDTKYNSGSGWPSFWDVLSQGSVDLREDNSYGMKRVEVVCKRCESHLGHMFEDGPRDTTGLRYCINSLALDFDDKTDAE